MPWHEISHALLVYQEKKNTRHVCVIAMTRTLPTYVVTPNDSVVTQDFDLYKGIHHHL